VTHKKQNII